MVILCSSERASSVHRLRRSKMTPQLCHCRPASQTASSFVEFCASSSACTARLRGSQHCYPACRRGGAAGGHLNTTARVKRMHILGDGCGCGPSSTAVGSGSRPGFAGYCAAPSEAPANMSPAWNAIAAASAPPPQDLTFGWLWSWLLWTSASATRSFHLRLDPLSGWRWSGLQWMPAW